MLGSCNIQGSVLPYEPRHDKDFWQVFNLEVSLQLLQIGMEGGWVGGWCLKSCFKWLECGT